MDLVHLQRMCFSPGLIVLVDVVLVVVLIATVIHGVVVVATVGQITTGVVVSMVLMARLTQVRSEASGSSTRIIGRWSWGRFLEASRHLGHYL